MCFSDFYVAFDFEFFARLYGRCFALEKELVDHSSYVGVQTSNEQTQFNICCKSFN